MQGVGNSQLVDTPARETTLLHHSARKADCDSEKPTSVLKDPQPLEVTLRRESSKPNVD